MELKKVFLRDCILIELRREGMGLSSRDWSWYVMGIELQLVECLVGSYREHGDQLVFVVNNPSTLYFITEIPFFQWTRCYGPGVSPTPTASASSQI